MTRGRLITAALVIALLLGVIADLIAITLLGFEQGNPFGGTEMAQQTGTLNEFTTPIPTLGPTATPTPVPPLESQLREALSIDGKNARGLALLVVAQHAVLANDYWTAIRATSATPWKSEQAKNLRFVVRCAIEDGLYSLAADAAEKVKYDSNRDTLKVEVIEARRLATFELDRLPFEQASRETMSCFTDPSE